MSNIYDIVIIGGGPSGMMAAIEASANGLAVALLEKNEKLGKKLYITGKGRCNLTNYSDTKSFMENVVTNPKFCFSMLNQFSSFNLMEFIESQGCKLKVERGNRVFPQSDKSNDIIKILESTCKKRGVKIKFNFNVVNIIHYDDVFYIEGNETVKSKKVIIATGGISYKATGSTGDGYLFARKFGHTVIKPVAGLVGINIKAHKCDLAGLSLKNVKASIKNNEGKILYSEFGEMLFTHTGYSGPIILSLSSKINRKDINTLSISIDFKPALSEEVLTSRFEKDIQKNKEKLLKNVLTEYLPSNFVMTFIKYCGIMEDAKMKHINTKQCKTIISAFKDYKQDIESLADINTAIITSGGIDVNEINPKTMESKIVSGLYFCGEVIDIDALTGGFNLQLAFSSGFCAGNYCRKSLEEI